MCKLVDKAEEALRAIYGSSKDTIKAMLDLISPPHPWIKHAMEQDKLNRMVDVETGEEVQIIRLPEDSFVRLPEVTITPKEIRESFKVPKEMIEGGSMAEATVRACLSLERPQRVSIRPASLPVSLDDEELIPAGLMTAKPKNRDE